MSNPYESSCFQSWDTDCAEVLIEFQRRLEAASGVDIAEFAAGLGDRATPAVLCVLSKIDLTHRFDLGLEVAAREYLDRFPALAADPERALSLIFEEYCLQEEAGREPETSEFCRRYASWGDSLHDQIVLHRGLSRFQRAEADATEFPAPGQRFAKFELDSILGRGGAATVFLARDRSLGGRQFVLKVSRNRGSEPSILGKLNHRHIVPVHSVDVEPETGLRGLCMPYLPGPTLDLLVQRIAGSKPPRTAGELKSMILAGNESPDLASPIWNDFPSKGGYAYGVAWIIWKLAGALVHAHSHGILHRDVKPANILLSYEQGPLLLDFNLAHASATVEEAEAAARGGTLPYMAPEQLRAFLGTTEWADVGPEADIYALGLILRELLTGVPRDSRSGARLSPSRAIHSALDERSLEREPLHLQHAGVPPVLSAIVDRCLAFDPADRYRSAADLVDDIGNFLLHRPTRHVKNPSLRASLGDWLTRGDRGRRLLLVAAISGPLILWAGTGLEKFGRARQANRLFLEGRYLAASPLIQELFESDPSDPTNIVRWAICLQHSERESEASRLLRERAGDSETRDRLAEESRRSPESAALTASLARWLLDEGRSAEALPLYEELRERGGPRWQLEASAGVARIHAENGRARKLFEVFQSALEATVRDFRNPKINVIPDVEEFARLVGVVDTFLSARLDKGDEATIRIGATCLLRGSQTLISEFKDRKATESLAYAIDGLARTHLLRAAQRRGERLDRSEFDRAESSLRAIDESVSKGHKGLSDLRKRLEHAVDELAGR
ncbi:MAG: protein kinase [Isosphaeraceae bacterium]|nr:protein kinase [Isosphaeraceae bacterium]